LLIAGLWMLAVAFWPRRAGRPEGVVTWVTARRMDLATTVVAGGDLHPAKETLVTCEVENSLGTDGAAIVSLVANGTQVKKGDELCRLDSSALVEEERQEEIHLNQTRAIYEEAKLKVEIAKLALREYRDGVVAQRVSEYRGKIALGRSDVQRQGDRVAWLEAMNRKGYASVGTLLSEQQALAKAKHELARSERELDVFERFTSPKETVRLQGDLQTAEINYRVEADRLKTQEELLAEVRRQLQNCVVRAPHDGMAVRIGTRGWWSRPVEEGINVYERQTLFKLPDLSQMEVEVSIHETFGPRVKAGMKATVYVASIAEGFPARVMHVTQLPGSNWKEWDESLMHFVARVRLEKTPVGALPFMSASVEIETDRVLGALVIPIESMSVIHGRQTCTVLAEDGPEPREIKTRRVTTELLEVIEGLEEGEQVALPREATGVGAERVGARVSA
jgi:HlyD family secretion protein